MIPLVSIAKFIASIFLIITSYKVFLSWRKKRKNETFNIFFKFAVSAAITIFLFVLPPLVKNLYLIQLVIDAIYIFMAISTGYFIFLTSDLTGLQKYRRPLSRFYSAGTLLLVVLLIIFFNKAEPYNYQFMGYSFIWWTAGTPLFIKIFYTIFLTITTIFFTTHLFSRSFMTKDSYLKKKSFLLGSGVILIGVAGIIYFLAETFLIPNFWLDSTHSFFAIAGSVLICASVFYKDKRAKTGKTTEEEPFKF